MPVSTASRMRFSPQWYEQIYTLEECIAAEEQKTRESTIDQSAVASKLEGHIVVMESDQCSLRLELEHH